MMRGGHHRRAWLAAAWVTAVSTTVHAAPSVPESVSEIAGEVAAVRAASARHDDAEARVARIRDEQDALARRITRLKKSGDQPAMLDRLLKRSLDADATFEAAQTALVNAEHTLEVALTRAVSRVDAEIRARVPRLRRGPMAARRRAAVEINELRAVRKRLRAQVAALANERRRAKAWAQYRVRFDARDGPSELTEKADFVEDTRDKVGRKRRALIQLLAEAQQEREIAEAAQDFRTDVTLFDEETRQGRVLRQGGPDGQTSVGEAADPTPTGPNPSRGDDAPPEVDAHDDFSQSDAEPPVTPQTTPTPQIPALRAINPDVLINLRVEDLAAGALDVATLEKYIADLKALERFLSGQADSLRDRAEALEADETRNLQK